MIPSTQPLRGFTLLEMIVSVGLFSIVMLVVSVSYLNLIDLDRQTRSTNQLVSNLSFALESMTRNIRTGTNFACQSPSGPNNTSGTCSCFSFSDPSSKVITYLRKTDGTIGQNTGVSASCLDSTAVSLTDVHVSTNSSTGLLFYVSGVGLADGVQPHVTITLRGSIVISPTRSTTFSIETGAVQRLIDL